MDRETAASQHTQMSDEELQEWIESISLSSFGVPFRHQARFNTRLSSTGGRYFLKSHNIEINPHQLAAFGRDEVERIIKHELCHYHLHLRGMGYKHRDADFKTLLAQVGGVVIAGPYLLTMLALHHDKHDHFGTSYSVLPVVTCTCGRSEWTQGVINVASVAEGYSCMSFRARKMSRV